jgi:hypothetical protein
MLEWPLLRDRATYRLNKDSLPVGGDTKSIMACGMVWPCDL